MTKRTTTRAQSATPLLADLNAEQLRAVTHASGPLLIVAGAGTGKTTVITRRIAWLILERRVPTDGILALTFTEKAATEMEERVDRLLPYGYVDLWIQTFHGFCERILKRHALDIGLPNDFTLIDPTAAWLLMRKHLDRFDLNYYRPRGNPTKFLHALHEHFSRCKDEAVGPEDYLNYAKQLQLNTDTERLGTVQSKKAEVRSKKVDRIDTSNFSMLTSQFETTEHARIAEVANAYHVYQQLLLEEGALDFGDLLVYTLQLLRERPAMLARYRKQFPYILVDEFQDTNWAQYEIVKLLAAPANNLTVVCDDDQAIYRWRGASMSNILHFKEDYPKSVGVSITANYRSRQSILDAAYRCILQNNPARLEVALKLSKELKAVGRGSGIIEVLHAPDANEEARLVVGKILKLHHPHPPAPPLPAGRGETKKHSPPSHRPAPAGASEEGERPVPAGASGEGVGQPVSWNDFAILVRANRHAEQFLPALNAAGIPYQFLASRGLYRKPIILDILAYLQLLDDYHESPACYRVLNIPTFGFTYDELLTLTNWAGRKAKSLYEVLREARAVPGIAKETLPKIDRVLALLAKHAELSRTASVREAILAFLEESGVLREITDEETAEDHETVGYLNQFWKRVEAFEEGTDAPTVKRFMEVMDLEREAGDEGALPADPNAGPEAVKVLTVHAAKGLEFRYVFVVNMVEQRFPATDRSEPIAIPDALTKVIVPEGDVHMAEERRLFYVALTRAKEGVFLTYADDYGGARKRKLSRFIEEIGIDAETLAKQSVPSLQGVKRARSLASARDRLRNPVTERHGIAALAASALTMTPVTQVSGLRSQVSPPSHALPSKLSFTQLRAYQTCPWQYHYAHVLRVPIRGRFVFSFGQTMHVTLQRFFERIREVNGTEQSSLFSAPTPSPDAPAGTGRSPSPGEGEKENYFPTPMAIGGRRGGVGNVPTLDDLLKLYADVWINDWYESKRQAKEYFENGKRILREFYAKHESEGWPSVHATEQPFTVKFGVYSVLGKADRIDTVATGVEIIDYKTGRPRERLEAEDKMQLLIYQIAATQVLGLTPKVLSYYYLEDNTKVSFLGTHEEIAGLEEAIANTGKRIANGDFAPTPGRHCQYCDFKNICPYAQA